MCKLLEALKTKDPSLAEKINYCKRKISPILSRTLVRFPTYTDHALPHSIKVMKICGYLIKDIDEMTNDELFILLEACILHDVGMAIDDKMLKKYCKTNNIEYCDSFDDLKKQEIVREYHHLFSEMFIKDNWKVLGIPTGNYAKAIALVAKGHRKIKLEDENIYQSIPVKDSDETVRVKYLSVILRMADEFDISEERTPELYSELFWPENAVSQKEFENHLNTQIVNFSPDGKTLVNIQFRYTNESIRCNLETLVEKIKKTLEYCQKVLIFNKLPELKISLIDQKYEKDSSELEPQKKSDILPVATIVNNIPNPVTVPPSKVIKEKVLIGGEIEKSEKLVWLHLSDLHFQLLENVKTVRMRDMLLKKLEEFVIIQKIDFVVVTGDLSYRGTMSKNELTIFLDQILMKISLSKENLYIIPGNNDVLRTYSREDMLNGVLSTSSELNENLEVELLKGQSAFFEFYEEYFKKNTLQI